MTTKSKKDYSQGKIYKIEPLGEHDEGDIYIGSTSQKWLSERMAKHRCAYKRWKLNLCKQTLTSFNVFEKYGVEKCKIVLIEAVNASSYDVLVSREAYYIRLYKCVNHVVPLRTHAEYYVENKEKILEQSKKYKEEHKEKYKEYDIKYREKNEEKIRENKKLYREENKEKIKEQKMKYREENKEAIKERSKKYREEHKENQKATGLA